MSKLEDKVKEIIQNAAQPLTEMMKELFRDMENTVRSSTGIYLNSRRR